MDVNVGNIINTPDKIIRRAYDELKSNYTKAGAFQYYDVYSKMPLSVIIRNAKFIYAEPFKGYEFVSNLVQNTPLPISAYGTLKEQVDQTIAQYEGKLSTEQMNDLKHLSQRIQMKMMQFGNIPNLIKFTSGDINDTNQRIMDVYDAAYKAPNECVDLAEKNLSNRLDTLPDYMRIMIASHHPDKIAANVSLLSTADDDKIADTCNKMHLSNVMTRVMDADYFKNHQDHLPMHVRHKIEEAAATDAEVITHNELTAVEKISEAYTDPQVLINTMYENAVADMELESLYAKRRDENLMIEKTILEINSAYLYNDYINNPDGLYEESLTDDSISSQIMLNQLTAMMERCDEIDSLITYERKNNGTAPEVISDNYDMGPEAPKESLSRRIQNAGLDADVRAKKVAAKARRGKQNWKNATKAVAKVPNNITKAIDDSIEEFDDADDERRKDYIAKPGYRKKIFRGLKLAFAHLLAFKISPIINIILFIATKLGGEKDKRIRNELVRELKTEIKVCEQKIDDAKSDVANGKADKQVVYKLMRMHDKLLQELERVETNSQRV